MSSATQLEAMKALNKIQAEFYNHKKKNAFTRLWSWGRGVLLRGVRINSGINDEVLNLHRQWMGSLEGKRVLDLGCFSGNALSLEIAARCKSYLGIDLSEKGIDELKQKIDAQGLTNARALAIDFLSEEFDQEGPFDVIYFYGAMHHFQHFEVLLERLNQFLAPGGQIITYDPTETAPIVRLARRIYRPFQSDAAWEWPLNKKSYELIRKHFEVAHIQGYLGKSKRAIMLSLVPASSTWKARKARKWHQHDLAHANHFGPALYSCMHVAMELRKK